MMAKHFLRMVLLVAAGLSAGVAQAQSLKAVRAQDAENARLAREIGYTNSVCGASMSARIDWRSAAGWPKGESLADACDGALGAIEAACRGKGKSRLGGLSGFVCAGDGAGPDLKGSTFRYGATPGVSGFSETRSYLDGAL